MSMQQIMFASLASGGDFVINGSGLFNGTDGLLRFEPSSAETSLVTGCVEFIVKHTELGTQQVLLTGQSSNATYSLIQFNSSDQLDFQIRSSATNRTHLVTTQVFRDPSAWMFIRVFYDSTPASPGSSDIGIEINGTQVTDFATETYSVQNWPWQFTDNAMKQTIGAFFDSADASSGPVNHFGGYMARALVLDGTKGTSTQAAELTSDGFWQINDASELTFGTNGFLLTGQNVSTGTDSSLVATADRPTTTVSASSSQYTGATGTATFLADDLTVASNSSVRVNDTFTGDFSISFDGYNGGTGIGRTLLYPSSEDGTYNSAVQPGANYGDFTGNQFLIDHNDGSYYSNGASLTASLGATYGVRVTVTRKGSVLSIYYNGAFKAVFANGYSGTLRLVHGGAQATATINTVNWTDWSATGLPNDFTATGITATSDSPTNGGDDNEYGNYETLDPNNTISTLLTEGNLNAITAGGVPCNSVGTLGITSGKHYFEYTQTVGATTMVGVCDDTVDIYAAALHNAVNPGAHLYYAVDGNYYAGGDQGAYGASYGVADVIGVAVDFDADTLVMYKNNASQGTMLTGLPSVLFPCHDSNSTNGHGGTFNFGATAFTYTPPTDHLAWATQNLPTPAPINYEDEYYIEAGISHTNGSTTAVTIPFDLDATGAMVRIKRTDSTGDWYVLDTVRGDLKYVKWNDRSFAEADFSDGGFSGTTFTISSDFATGTYLLEAFKIGSYFQIKTFTGTGSAHAETFPSALDTAPGMMWIKYRTDTSNDQLIYHESLGNTKYLHSNSASVALTSTTIWNNTSPTTTQFTVGTNGAVNTNGGTYVLYAWANSGPYSFGVYDSNLSADGPMINLSGSPATFGAKRNDGNWNWVQASQILGDNENYQYLENNNTTAVNSTTTVNEVDFLSNGMKMRDAGNNNFNGTAGADHLYWAFGIQPMTDGSVDQSRAR